MTIATGGARFDPIGLGDDGFLHHLFGGFDGVGGEGAFRIVGAADELFALAVFLIDQRGAAFGAIVAGIFDLDRLALDIVSGRIATSTDERFALFVPLVNQGTTTFGAKFTRGFIRFFF